MPSALQTAANRFRRELLNNERQSASAMVEVYGASWGRVSQQIGDLQGQITAAQASGQEVNADWLFRFERAQSLQGQIEAELRRFGSFATDATLAQQMRAVEAAGRHSAGMVDLAAGIRPVGIEVPFDVLPTAAMQDLVGYASDGSPLRELFGEISGGVADRVTSTFVSSLAAGFNPRVTARLLRRAFGTGLTRALVIARTETMRSYREAAHRNYENNNDVLEGWIWMATLSTRTCAACFAQHGRVFPLTEKLNGHPNCRCTPIPKVKSWRALGYDIPDNRPVIESGAVEFSRLTPQDQRTILGPSAFAAFLDGAVSLEQFATERHSDDWGDTIQVASLRSLLGSNLARQYTRESHN